MEGLDWLDDNLRWLLQCPLRPLRRLPIRNSALCDDVGSTGSTGARVQADFFEKFHDNGCANPKWMHLSQGVPILVVLPTLEAKISRVASSPLSGKASINLWCWVFFPQALHKLCLVSEVYPPSISWTFLREALMDHQHHTSFGCSW